MENEIWKDVKGFSGRYQVSNLGRVRYAETWITRTYTNGTVAHYRIRKSAIKVPHLSKTGQYYYIALINDKERIKWTCNVDELVAMHFCCDYKKGKIIIHKDGNTFNNRSDNLLCVSDSDIPGEMWKPVIDYEGLYEVSNMGRVRSLDKVSRHDYKYQKNVIVPVDGKYLKGHLLNNGYVHVVLHKGSKRKNFALHRLVAFHFCDGYAEGLVVNHKNENKVDNRAENLEWCTEAYNRNYGTRNERCAKSNQKRVAQYTSDGVLIAEYESGKEASEKTGYHRACISDWCRGAHPCKSGFIWKFI